MTANDAAPRTAAGRGAETAKRGWEKRKAAGWESAAQRHQKRLLDDLRRRETATAIQAHFGHDLYKIAEWCVATCLAAGSSVHTAYLVAGTMTEGLAAAWSDRP